MFNKKRGLSDVITTLLIILLAIAAVAIIWVFVGPAIQKGVVGVGKAECVNTNVEPVKCTVTTGQVTIKNDDTITRNVYAVVEHANKQIDKSARLSVPQLSTVVSGLIPNTVASDTARVVVVITTSDGTEINCPESIKAIRCA